MDYDVVGQTVYIYGFSNNIDPRTLNIDDTYAVF
jgi:hypothetical protein